MREGDVGAVGGVGGLLQEYGVAGYFADVDGDGEALAWTAGVLESASSGLASFGREVPSKRRGGGLTSENGVHDGDVLVREVAGYGED